MNSHNDYVMSCIIHSYLMGPRAYVRSREMKFRKLCNVAMRESGDMTFRRFNDDMITVMICKLANLATRKSDNMIRC